MALVALPRVDFRERRPFAAGDSSAYVAWAATPLVSPVGHRPRASSLLDSGAPSCASMRCSSARNSSARVAMFDLPATSMPSNEVGWFASHEPRGPCFRGHYQRPPAHLHAVACSPLRGSAIPAPGHQVAGGTKVANAPRAMTADKRYRMEADRACIDIELKSARQLFDERDPSHFESAISPPTPSNTSSALQRRSQPRFRQHRALHRRATHGKGVRRNHFEVVRSHFSYELGGSSAWFDNAAGWARSPSWRAWPCSPYF